MRKRTGSIDRTEAGTFRLRVSHGGKRTTVGVFPTMADARRERFMAMRAIGAGADPGMTLAAWIGSWLDARETSGKYRYRRGLRGWFEQHIENDPIAKVPLKRLTSDDVDELMGRLRLTKRGSLVKIRQLLNGSLKLAARKGLIRSNPAAAIEIAHDLRTDRPWTYATLAEQEALRVAARAHAASSKFTRMIPLDALLDFAIGSGLRAGELAALKLEDVHLDGEAPHITVRFGKPPALPTKSGKIREVPLFGIALDGLRRWVAAIPLWCKANPHGLAFPRNRGEHRDEGHIIYWKSWGAIRAAAGITRRFRWHDLRHTCASALVSGMWGRFWALIEVRDMLGHSAISTTERYAHLADTALKNAARETAMSWSAAKPENATIAEETQAINAGAVSINHASVRPGFGEGSRAVATWSDQLQGLAIETQRAIARGEGKRAHALARDLAQAVLATSHVQLAMGVLAGGPTTLMRAGELADLLTVAVPSATEAAS